MKNCKNWKTVGVYVVLATMLAAGSAAQTQSADERALMDYRLTMDNVDKYAAAMTNVFSQIRANPALAKEIDVDVNLSLDQMMRRIDSVPAFAQSLRAAGMTSRDFILTQLALFQAAMVAGFKKAGVTKELPPGISPDNVAFYEQNEAELTKKLDAVQKMAEQFEDKQEEAEENAKPPRH